MNKLFTIACFVILFNSFSYSQYENIGTECSTESSVNLINIPVKTSGSSEYLRCLMIYITFPDDNELGYDYSIWERPTTLPNSKPINPYPGTNGRLIDSLLGNPLLPFMSMYNSYTMSDFFCEMSMGQFHVIGDEISITLPKTSTEYDLEHFDRASLNRYVLSYLDSIMDIDWSRYDKWSYDNGWVFEPDGTAEVILMNYRRIPNNDGGWFWSPGTGGEASLGFTNPITLGNVTIGFFNGITALNMMHATGRSLVILEHEFSHKLFGDVFPFADPLHTNVGFMTPGHDHSTFIYTPMERAASVVNYITPNLIDQSGIYTDTLHDFTESGETHKIKIPGTSSEFVWIANHQKKAVYDGVSRGGSNCYAINFAEIDPFCSDGKGLYIYREGSGCTNLNEPYDVISAEGRFNWIYDRTVNVPEQNYIHSLGFPMDIFKISTGSRYTGVDEYRKSVNTTHQFLTDDECSSNPDDYSISWDTRGDGLDAFNMGYEEIFSPYSNPSSSFCNSTNTGLTFALKEKLSFNGAIVVKTYYNNDVTALQDLPPSKPKNVKTVAQTISPTSFHPKITWDPNIEPDFVSDTYGEELVSPAYEIYRGSAFSCQETPTYNLVATVLPHVTQFVDSSIIVYLPRGSRLDPGCNLYKITYSYKIVAKDNRGDRSLKSERGLISGYTILCEDEDAEMEDMFNLNENETPKEYSLKQNYPNPYNPVTSIRFELPIDNFVTITVYDLLGKEIKTIVSEYKTAGNYVVSFDGSYLSSGIYYYKMKSGDYQQIRKMILIK